MGSKAILDIELNDDEFKQFQSRFSKFQEEAKEAVEVWKHTGGGSGGGGGPSGPSGPGGGGGGPGGPGGAAGYGTQWIFDSLKDVTKEQKVANQNFRVTAGAWNSSIKHLKQFHNFISQSTFQLAQWTGLTSLFGSILAGGGLYGINRMAQSAMTMRQQAGGYGVSPGELAATQTAFGRLGDMTGVLQGFSGALHDIQKRRPLVGLLGQDYNKRTAGKDASQVFVDTLPDIKRKLDSLDERTFQLMTSNKGLGLDELGITPEMARRIRNTKPEEIQEMIQIYKGGKNRFGADDATLQKWADFSTKVNRAGEKLESTFIHLFAPFTKGMERATSIFTFVLKVAFKIGEKAITLLKSFWAKFNSLFQGKGTEFAANVKQFVAAARNIEEIILRFFAVGRAMRKGGAGSQAEGGAGAGAEAFGNAVKRAQRGVGGSTGGDSSPTSPSPTMPKNATPWSPSSTGPGNTGGGTGYQSSPASGDAPIGPGSPDNYNQIRNTFNAAAKHPEWGLRPGSVATVQVKRGNQTWQVAPRAQKDFQGFLDEMHSKHPEYKIISSGGYNNRLKRGESTPSMHDYGTAIDINAPDMPFHSGRNTLPSDTEEIAARHGLSWGKHFGDPMHFEYTGIKPEFNTTAANRRKESDSKDRGISHKTTVNDNTGGAANVSHDTRQGAIQ